MAEDLLATQYHLEIYPGSLDNDPLVVYKSNTPFAAMSVGDYIEAREFDAETFRQNGVLQVEAVQHFLWVIEGSHIGHKLMIVVSSVPNKKLLSNFR